MGQGGEDIQLSQLARTLFPYAIECKSLAKFAGYNYWGQAMTHMKDNTQTPIAVIKANHNVPLVLVSLDHFLELIKKNNDSQKNI